MNEKALITDIHRVILVGKEEYDEKITTFESKKLHHNELIFHVSGEALVIFDNLRLKTAPGTVRFLPSGEHCGYSVIRESAGECIDVFFDTNIPLSDKAFVVDMSKQKNIYPLFNKLLCIFLAKEEGYYFECVSILYKILAQIQKNRYLPGEKYEKIKPAVELIGREFLKRDISISELCSVTGISESYLKRLFHLRFGTSPKKYIIQMKINHASELLRLGRYTVTRVAEICNFSDVYFFSRQFKEYTGVSPAAFSKKYLSSK